MRFFIIFFISSLFVAPLGVRAQVASSVTSVPTASAQSVSEILPPPSPAENPLSTLTEIAKPDQSTAPKGEFVEWRNAYVSGVSASIITVVVATKQRRKSYEPVMIALQTKIMRGSKPATLGEIKIRQYVSVRGYRDGDIVKADEFVIGGHLSRDPIARPVAMKRGGKQKKSAAKKTVPHKKLHR